MSEVRGSVANAHAFVQRLIDLGLKHAVLSPGSRNAPISITLAKAAELGLITLHVRIDEREAAFFALGLGKMSDIPALLCCTSGTAAVNFAPAVVEAAYSQVPMLVLTADRPAGAAARGASQSIEQEHMFAPHSIANLSVSEHADANAAADRARIAWNASRGAKRGAAHVNMHLTEPLLDPIEQWPQLNAPTVVDVAESIAEPAIEAAVLNFGERPVFVIGELPHHERAAAHAALTIAQELGIPVLMEPTAGSRDSIAAIRHHALVAVTFAQNTTCVISVGRFGLGRHLRRICENAPTHIAFGAYGSGADPYATADVTLPARHIAAALAQMPSVESSWLQQWRDADAAAQRKIDAVVGKWVEQPTGIQIAKEVLVAASADDSLLFAAASRSIRDVDLVADHNGPNVVANLGVNGIDGLISTAAGIATFTNRHTYLLIGDIAFLHGSNGLLFPADELRPSLTIVVNDDNGGAIFSDLEQGAAQYSPWFERVFGTPHDLDLVVLARGYGVDAVEVFDLTQLRDALTPHEGIRVVVVAGCDREKSRDMRAALRTS